MTKVSVTQDLNALERALGRMRAEYESDADLYGKFRLPSYFEELKGVSPNFLVGGRGTGKTTTLRSMAFQGQRAIAQSNNPHDWDVVGAYWKVEPNVVSSFSGKGLSEKQWEPIFSHFLNLKLASLVLDYAIWLEGTDNHVGFNGHAMDLFARSLHFEVSDSVPGMAREVDRLLADLEALLNGRVSALVDLDKSVLGRPLDYLIAGLSGLAVSPARPFMFCLDEYENLSTYQQILLNTLVKQVGAYPYTFKIGVRNTVGIDRQTLIENQPLQEPADFRTVDIIDYLKGSSFEEFASRVLIQRFASLGSDIPTPNDLLPVMPMEEEAEILGSGLIRLETTKSIIRDPKVSSEEVERVYSLSNVEVCLVAKWSESHHETPLDTLRYAIANPQSWRTRLGNYGYASLFTIRQNKVGDRKYYTGWRTYCQLADGNIRYLIRLMYEALRLSITGGSTFQVPVSYANQTKAAAKVGETTIKDLQGWSRQGAALTRMALGLGSIFGTLARESAMTTPEVTQFRINFKSIGSAIEEKVDRLLSEAVGQGILISFDGDKNGRMSGATREMDYQLHPVFSPYFVYSPRRKRRTVINASDLLALTERETAQVAIRRVLKARAREIDSLPVQLTIFDEQ